MNNTALVRQFEAFCPIRKAGQQTADGPWLLDGSAALVDEPDFEDDVLLAKAVDDGLKMHHTMGGQVDFDHMYPKTRDPKWLIGKAVGHHLVGKIPFLTTQLHKHKPIAQSVWEHLDDPEGKASMGYSLWGFAKSGDPTQPKLTTKLDIYYMTIAPAPMGTRKIHNIRSITEDKAKDLYGEDVPIQKSFGGVLMDIIAELTAGDMRHWQQVDGGIEQQIEKAFTVGSGSVGDGAEGGASLRRESIAKAKGVELIKRCRHCGGMNRYSRKACVTCGEGFQAE